MLKLSILEQSPISEGSTPGQALENSTRLAKAAEKWGYRRIWFAEHHDSEGLASVSPEIMIAPRCRTDVADSCRIRRRAASTLQPL